MIGIDKVYVGQAFLRPYDLEITIFLVVVLLFLLSISTALFCRLLFESPFYKCVSN